MKRGRNLRGKVGLRPRTFLRRLRPRENEMVKLPDPKELVDSVADGAVEIAEGPARVAKNIASVADTYAGEVKANMDDFKARMPDDPAVIADVAVKAVGQTVKAGLGMAEGLGQGIMDTFEAVKGQIKRVTG